MNYTLKVALLMGLVMFLNSCAIPLEISQKANFVDYRSISDEIKLSPEPKAMFEAFVSVYSIPQNEAYFMAGLFQDYYKKWNKQGTYWDYIYSNISEIGTKTGKSTWYLRDILNNIKPIYDEKRGK
jgi:hypothetical protein